MTIADEYAHTLECLSRHGVDFVVCGGLACFLYGSTRHTEDLGVAVRLEDANLRRLIEAAKELRLQPRIPEPLENLALASKRAEWIEKKNALVFTLVSLTSRFQMDVFLRYAIDYDDLKSEAETMSMGDTVVHISSKRHLIQAKEAVQPPRLNDRFDIQFLQDLIAREQRR